jgi:hypothetical protein
MSGIVTQSFTPLSSDATTLQYLEQAIEAERPVDRAGPSPAAYEAWQYEADRRRLCNVIVLIYYLLILEGALRKWIAPGYQKELFFVRDPFYFLSMGSLSSKGSGLRRRYYSGAGWLWRWWASISRCGISKTRA